VGCTIMPKMPPISAAAFHTARNASSVRMRCAALSCPVCSTVPNAIVEPRHPKAMPVILTTEEGCNAWMRAS
jgi:putative SOS response-associated peptidase YedK